MPDSFHPLSVEDGEKRMVKPPPQPPRDTLVGICIGFLTTLVVQAGTISQSNPYIAFAFWLLAYIAVVMVLMGHWNGHKK